MIQNRLSLVLIYMHPLPRCQGGFTFIWLMFLVAGLGVGMAALGTMWHTATQREKEAELLFVGDQYRRAIESFWNAGPSNEKRLPKHLDELLQDPRFPNTVRHLRRAYPDPFMGAVEWGVVHGVDGGITGVFSQSERTPLKQGNFANVYSQFATAKGYRDWVFVAEARALTQPVMGGDMGTANSNADAAGKTDATAQLGETPDELKKRMQCLDAKDQGFIRCRKPGVDQVQCEEQVWRVYASCEGA